MYFNCYSILLSHGAPANCTDSKGRTPMHNAAFVGATIDIAELKEKGGANINHQDNKGKTPLFYAKGEVFYEGLSFDYSL